MQAPIGVEPAYQTFLRQQKVQVRQALAQGELKLVDVERTIEQTRHHLGQGDRR